MGDTPTLFLNIRLKWEELEKPHAKAISVMDKIAEDLPAGFAAEWTDLAFQQKAVGNVAALIFALSVVFVLRYVNETRGRELEQMEG